MMKRDKFLEAKFGHDNHFSVPDGYFDDFATRLMEQIPEEDNRKIVLRPRKSGHIVTMRLRIIIAAACLCAAIFSVSGYMLFSPSPTPQQTSNVSADKAMQPSGAAALQQVADYAMLDNNDIYAYVSEQQ
jgi:hypothetical protein